ncbi:unnamed protein product [Boreogadus saida]
MFKAQVVVQKCDFIFIPQTCLSIVVPRREAVRFPGTPGSRPLCPRPKGPTPTEGPHRGPDRGRDRGPVPSAPTRAGQGKGPGQTPAQKGCMETRVKTNANCTVAYLLTMSWADSNMTRMGSEPDTSSPQSLCPGGTSRPPTPAEQN